VTEDTQETAAVEDVLLHPFIVFQHDARWAACIEELQSGPPYMMMHTEPCTYCNGTGKLDMYGRTLETPSVRP